MQFELKKKTETVLIMVILKTTIKRGFSYPNVLYSNGQPDIWSYLVPYRYVLWYFLTNNICSLFLQVIKTRPSIILKNTDAKKSGKASESALAAGYRYISSSGVYIYRVSRKYYPFYIVTYYIKWVTTS